MFAYSEYFGYQSRYGPRLTEKGDSSYVVRPYIGLVFK
jgi:hypothetical protein